MSENDQQFVEEQKDNNYTDLLKVKPYPTVGDILAIVGVFFCAAVLMGLAMTFFSGLEMPQSMMTFVAYVGQMLIVIAFVIFQRHARGAGGKVIDFSFRNINSPQVLWGVVLLLLVSVVIEPLLEIFPDRYLDMLDNAVGTGGWALLTTVVMAPILEELIFRGYILGSIRWRSGSLKAVFFSALIFGAVHIIPQQVINAFIVGLFLGYIYVRTGSIWSVILIHAVNNAISYLTMVLFDRDDITWNVLIPNRTLYHIVYAACCLLLVLSMVKLYLNLRNKAVVDSPDE